MKKKFTKKQKEVLRGLWKDVNTAKDNYCKAIEFIESQAKHTIGVDVEVFHVDGSPVGFGTYDREYELWQDTEGEI